MASKPAPKPQRIRAARKRAGLTQTEAAALLHTGLRTWQQWEGDEAEMHPAFWELFEIKAKELSK